MQHNADFSARVVIDSDALKWQDSPMPGVRRRILDRIGGEVARATTVVQYAPGSQFSPHVHTGGEEFIVLDGVFQDEHGDFPAGSYIRNPPQSSHTPGSNAGCVIFVKLWQFDLNDRTHVCTDITSAPLAVDPDQAGVHTNTLFEDSHELVRVQNWAADANVSVDTSGGAELFVLDGTFTEGVDSLVKHCWMRIPVDGSFNARAGSSGATVWIKTGHLRDVASQVERINARNRA